MKAIIAVLSFFFTVPSFAQDSNSVKMKEWLGVLTVTEKYADEKNWTAADQAKVEEHFQRLIKMKDKGIVILAGRTELALNDPAMQGLVIFYANNEKEANEFMQKDPAVQVKIMQAKVYPYGVAVNKCN